MPTEITIVPGDPEEWQEFENADYDPEAVPGSDEDTIGEMLAERRKAGKSFGIMITADPTEVVTDELLKRIAADQVPLRVRRASREEYKVGEKKSKKSKKE